MVTVGEDEMASFRTMCLPLLLASAFCAGVASSASVQTATEWASRASEQYEAGEFAESADSFARAIEAGAESGTVFYNAACSAALAGQADAAFEHLDGALARDWRNIELLRHDSDLEPLHEDPRWKDVVLRCEQAVAVFIASLEEPELRSELLEMYRVDQAMRRGEEIPGLEGKAWSEIDGRHTARMKEIVAEHGWPTKTLVGSDGANATWLIVQHADADPVFQRRCLELMRRVPEGEISLVDLAYLTDRVLVNEGTKQIYGTQFWTVDGKLVPRPIEDESGLAARRESLGMITMEEYTAIMTGKK
jgi:tetratricopeptide (TPR) repeat protein